MFFSDDVNKHCLPFPGSDRSVVLRSQHYRYHEEKKRPVSYVIHNLEGGPQHVGHSVSGVVFTVFVLAVTVNILQWDLNLWRAP